MAELLTAAGVGVVVDASSGVPTIVHWGRDPGAWTDEPVKGPPPGGLDVSAPITLVPMHADGFPGRPGLAGHRRGGRSWSPRFVHESTACSAGRIEVVAVDRIAELGLRASLALRDDGVLIASATVENRGDSPYMLDAFSISLPLPREARRLGVFSGRWADEFRFEHLAWPLGAWTAENRLGRTSHERPPLLYASSEHADESMGEVWGMHLAWSGNHVVLAERLPDGRRYVQLGELFHPGEICVYPGESFSTPDVIGTYSASGFSSASRGFHREARRRLPRRLGPRPVHLNTWEAVYFRHDEATLRRLADRAAAIGVERFVLDDGWFGSRRSDRSGLGDWEVSTEVYPQGLAPLVGHVRGLGMQFGIWVEPEMANPDSDILRTHPEWVLATEGYEPILGRRQLVLDLTRTDAFAHVLGRLDALLASLDISYVKWDMNRPLVQGSGADGKAATHAQTLAVYRLVDELRSRHPDVEFESCSSGGGRIDFGIIRRVERFWTSDNNDPISRQTIQRHASFLVPPEVMGCHVGPSPAHVTGRESSMQFRVITAFFGHMGVEADLTALESRELDELARGIALHKEWRDLLHSGDSIRFDSDTSVVAHGLYAPERREALVSIARVAEVGGPVRLRLPELLPETTYRARVILGSAAVEVATITGRDASDDGMVVTGLAPWSAVLVHLSAS